MAMNADEDRFSIFRCVFSNGMTHDAAQGWKGTMAPSVPKATSEPTKKKRKRERIKSIKIVSISRCFYLYAIFIAPPNRPRRGEARMAKRRLGMGAVSPDAGG